MKRFGKSITALAVTGAMGIGLAPAASAQEAGFDYETNSSRTAVGSSKEGGLEATSSIAGKGSGETDGDAEGEGSGSMAGLSSKKDDSTGETDGDAAGEGSFAGLSSKKDGENTDGTGEGDVTGGSSLDELVAGLSSSANSGSATTDGDADGETDGKGETDGEGGSTAGSSDLFAGSSKDSEDTEGTDGDAPSGSSVSPELALGIALPAALLIGGVMWYLNQDGSTYVTDEARISSKPTKEEKKASDEMLKNNEGKVKAQAEAEAGDVNADSRGIAAETGSNTVARGLAALVLASLLGAVAFVARRRFAL